MHPHGKNRYKPRLSKMKLIAEYVRCKFNNDMDMFKRQFNSALTVNSICAAIRSERRSEH